MKSILIRNIDERTLSNLKRLASANHRSLQGELLHLLTRASRLAPRDEEGASLDLITVATGRSDSFDREDIYGDDGR